jgi:uncharacterized membrane protein YkoI
MIISTAKSLAAVALLLTASSLMQEDQEKEKKIQQSDLPPAVQQTVAKEKQGFSISGFEEEKEKGQTVYEAKFRIAGSFHKTDKSVTMDANGSILETEEWIAKGALSKAVLQGLEAQAGTGKIVNVKTVTKTGQLVAYEAKVMTGGKKSEVRVGPDGTPLAHEEEE